MHEEIKKFMQDLAFKRKFRKAKTIEKGHGRIETRTCWQTDDIDWFEDKNMWVGLKSVCMVTSVVYDMKKKTTSTETRYFISSLSVNPTQSLKAIRVHWGYGY